MRKFIEKLRLAGELKTIDGAVDIRLEMAHIAYAEVKKDGGGKALLFNKPVSGDREFSAPVLMNLYGSKRRMEMIFGRDVEDIAREVAELTSPEHPVSFFGKVKKVWRLLKLRKCFPKRLRSRGECQERIYPPASLGDLPILTTWSGDGGAFITMGQVYTRSLDGKMNNLGMYRLQVYGDGELGLHWQTHKDASCFFYEYEKAGARMPVSVAIGGDPLYAWCATAPLPKGIFELLLYGFVRKSPARLVKCLTNDLYVPSDADFVIEGFVENPRERKIEGEFGDHTGYYTPKEPYPFMSISAITSKNNPVFCATVVGKPPIEDKYMGFPTERIFLPLFRASCPDLIDYKMPENGVFHNLIVAKVNTLFDGHALAAAHAFWGVGQMSFVKHAVFVGSDAPALEDYEAIAKWCLDRFAADRVLVSDGILDALDHSSPKPLVGGKLAVDCARAPLSSRRVEVLSDGELLAKVQNALPEASALRQYFTDSKNPIALIAVKKTRKAAEMAKALSALSAHISIAAAIDESGNDVNNAYMSLWRACNNIDARRDLIMGDITFLDATAKNSNDGYERQWPRDTDLCRETIDNLKKRGLWEHSGDFEKRWLLFGEDGGVEP